MDTCLAWGSASPFRATLLRYKNLERPKTVSEMRAFLGLCKYNSGYVLRYAEIAALMTPC